MVNIITFKASVIESPPNCDSMCPEITVPTAVVDLPLPVTPTSVINLPLDPVTPTPIIDRPLVPVTQIFPTHSPVSGIGGNSNSLSQIKQQTAQLQLNTQTNTFACNLPNNVAIAVPTDSKIAIRSKAIASNSNNFASNACNTAEDEKQILQLLGETPNSSHSK